MKEVIGIRRSGFLTSFALSCAAMILSGCVQEKLDFASVEKVDAHVHIRYSGPEFLDQAASDNFKVISILLDHYNIGWQQNFIRDQRAIHPGQFEYLTAFTMDGWDEPDWVDKTIDHLNDGFEYGAIGVKVWKNIGMEFRDKDGNFVMIDDPRFDPIFDFIESRNRTLTAHIGEPRDCWLPVDEMLVSSNKRYYSNHPEYHMYLHPEYPAYEDHIRAYERVLEKHPTIRYVGCHLGSIEWNLEELSKRLDRFPNMAVDLAARIDDIQTLEREDVRQFFLNYHDRILYATDLGIDEEDDPAEYAKRAHRIWVRDWTYFATDSVMTIPGIDQPVRGLALPPSLLRKIYGTNADKWYPGILQTLD